MKRVDSFCLIEGRILSTLQLVAKESASVFLSFRENKVEKVFTMANITLYSRSVLD